MGRVLSTIIAVALLLGLGALAVLALPGTGAPMTASPVAAAPLAAEPDAPAAGTNKYNVIALPLDSQSQFSTYDAPGLAALVGPGVQEVSKLQAGTQTYLTYYPPIGDGDNFSMQIGGVYWLLLDSNANSVVSFVGNVPNPGTVHNTLTRPAGTGCLYNDIIIPLDQAAMTPQQLADLLGNVQEVSQLSAATQTFLTWYPDIQDGDTFSISIGYPYRVCLRTGGITSWP